MMKTIMTTAALAFLYLLTACESKTSGGEQKTIAQKNDNAPFVSDGSIPDRVQLPADAPPNEILKVEPYRHRHEHAKCENVAPCLVLELFLPSFICSQRAVGDLLNRHIRQYPAEQLSKRLKVSDTDIDKLLPSLYEALLAEGKRPPIEMYIGAEVTYSSPKLLCVGYSIFGSVHYLMLDMQDGHRLERREWLREDQEEELRRLLAAELRKTYNLSADEPLSKVGFRFKEPLPPLPKQMGYVSVVGQGEFFVAFYSNDDGATEQTGFPEIKIPFSKMKGILKMM